ncbi:MAG: glycoside hydrolase family 44 protein [Solirubrobacteraceae bacterium]
MAEEPCVKVAWQAPCPRAPAARRCALSRTHLQGTLALLVPTLMLLAGAGLGQTAHAEGSTAGPALAVNGAAGRHPISPDIYGMNFAEPGPAAELALPIDRWGGNTTDTYNFRIGADNLGSDWFYENIADCFGGEHEWCNGQPVNTDFAYREFISKDQLAGARTLFTLPLAGYVAKNAPVAHPLTCGFPTSMFPAQESVDEYDPGCGNGMEGGKAVASEPERDGTPIGASYDGAFVRDIVSRFGPASARGVAIYELGNEPGLWDSTHRDIHPSPTTYDELWQKSREAAIQVKEADPSAAVMGFSEWGWPNYFCSAADGAPQQPCSAGNTDRAAHGGVPLVEWFLQRFHNYEQSAGRRLLDYIDVHYYAHGGSDTEVTRSLWDPTYTDPSWIAAKIDLLPRMHEWVARNYPGTKISLSEYNLSVSSSPVVNALIQADALGIFAREGLDLATRWPLNADGPLIADAFRMYRNYDGQHGAFGDTYVSSTSADQNRLAVYGAQRSGDGAYTVMVVNKTAEALTSPLSLSGIAPSGPAGVWQWTGGSIARQANQALTSSGFSATYPPHSLTLFVIPCLCTGAPAPPGSTGSTRPPSAHKRAGAGAKRCCPKRARRPVRGCARRRHPRKRAGAGHRRGGKGAAARHAKPTSGKRSCPARRVRRHRRVRPRRAHGHRASGA